MENMKVGTLREIAKNNKIKNWWKMTKAELVSALTQNKKEETKKEEKIEVKVVSNEVEKNLKVIYW